MKKGVSTQRRWRPDTEGAVLTQRGQCPCRTTVTGQIVRAITKDSYGSLLKCLFKYFADFLMRWFDFLPHSLENSYIFQTQDFLDR